MNLLLKYFQIANSKRPLIQADFQNFTVGKEAKVPLPFNNAPKLHTSVHKNTRTMIGTIDLGTIYLEPPFFEQNVKTMNIENVS